MKIEAGSFSIQRWRGVCSGVTQHPANASMLLVCTRMRGGVISNHGLEPSPRQVLMPALEEIFGLYIGDIFLIQGDLDESHRQQRQGVMVERFLAMGKP